MTEWLLPSYDRHEAEAMRMIHDTDDNQDQLLNEEEIINNDDYFYSIIPGEYWRKYTDLHASTEPTLHDEF